MRRLSTRRGKLYALSGPVFEGGTIPALNRRVLVPAQLVKATHDSGRGAAAAYLTVNVSSGCWHRASIALLEAVAGIDVFPGLFERAEARAMDLPPPARLLSRRGARAAARPRLGRVLVEEGDLLHPPSYMA